MAGFETESLDDLDRALPPPSPPPLPPVSVPSPVSAPLSVDQDDIPDTVADGEDKEKLEDFFPEFDQLLDHET